MEKSQVVAVTLYPADKEIVATVMEDYGCNRSQAMRTIIRDFGRVRALAASRHVTVRELTDIIFSSFARDGG